MGSSSPQRTPPGSVDGEEDHPTTLIQFLMYLYINVADFRTLCMAGEFITALVATLFPYPLPDYSSDVTTPNEEYKVRGQGSFREVLDPSSCCVLTLQMF